MGSFLDEHVSRRHLLGGGVSLIVGVTAGCSLLNDPGTTEIVVHNARTVESKVMVTVTNPNRDEPLLDSEVVNVGPGEETEVGDGVPSLSENLATVDVSAGPGPAHPDWDDIGTSLHIIVHSEKLLFATGVGSRPANIG